MRIASGGRRLRVAQQLADDGEAEPAACTEARIGMPEIVQTNPIKPGAFCNCRPWALQAGMASRNRHRAPHTPELTETCEDCQCRSVQNDGLAGLQLGQKQQPALDIDVFPFEMEDFPKAATSE